ncbi:MAG: hypothetical protein II037_01285, partial [Bacteroidales bacterium]|nr:hypothetical protein [Bacteroidales bacterium]
LIILGIVKKGVLADYLAVYNNLAFDTPASYSGYELLMASIGYTMQIYLDFSGYSDLAIGTSAISCAFTAEGLCGCRMMTAFCASR